MKGFNLLGSSYKSKIKKFPKFFKNSFREYDCAWKELDKQYNYSFRFVL